MTHVTLKPLASEESIEVYGWLLANVGKGSFSKTGQSLDDDMQWAWHSVKYHSSDHSLFYPTILIFRNPIDATYFALMWASVCGEHIDTPIEHLL
jgi:hypothetical protein